MSGTCDGLFRPDAAITRAELAQILHNMIEQRPSGGLSFPDVPQDAWFTAAVRTMSGLGLMDVRADGLFHPNDPITRSEAAVVLYRLLGGRGYGTQSGFPDVPSSHPAYVPILWAANQGFFTGNAAGYFDPDGSLTRAEAAVLINHLLGRTPQMAKQLGCHCMQTFPDVPATHWAYAQIMEAVVTHSHEDIPTHIAFWPVDSGIEVSSLPNGFHRFNGNQYYVRDGCLVCYGGGSNISFEFGGSAVLSPGFHELDGKLYYADRHGNVVISTSFGAFWADSTGAVTQISGSYQIPNVTYVSQIDNIWAWVGCEATAALPGLWVKGYAQDVTLKYFLDELPRSDSDPEKGFVGSPYKKDRTKRTTIYPAKLAEYSNSYCRGDTVCTDFRGASVEELRRELLAGNCVVAYETLWWKRPTYGTYDIEGVSQRLVNNNHAVLVCGYDPEKGYFVSDPYNYYNRGEVYQYWEDAQTFDSIWNARKVGMLIQ